MFAWGSNEYGQLGLKTAENYSSNPIHVEAYLNAGVVRVVCGTYHTLCFSWQRPNKSPSDCSLEKILEERGFNKEEDLEKLLVQILENPSKNPEFVWLWNQLLKKDSI